MSDVSLSSWGELLEVAIRGRVESLRDDRGNRVPYHVIGNASGWTASQTSGRISARTIARSTEDFNATTVGKLQAYLDVHEPAQRSPIDLVTFYQILNDRVDASPVRIPASFARPLMDGAPPDSHEKVCVAAEALAAARRTAPSFEGARQVYRRLNDGEPLSDGPVDRLIRQMCELVTIPSRWNQLLLRELGALRDWTVPIALDVALTSPAGWRATRALGIVLRNLRHLPEGTDDSVARQRELVRGALRELVNTPPGLTLDPSRGFLEEALRHAPGSDSKDGYIDTWDREWSFAVGHLKQVATDTDAAPRHRAFAALCLAERRSTATMVPSIVQLMRELDGNGQMRRIADFLEHKVGETETRTRIELEDDIADALRRRITSACFDSIPENIREPVAGFVRRSVLFYDTSKRRIACDVILAAGVRSPAAAVLSDLLSDSSVPFTVRDNASVVLGYLGDPLGQAGLVSAARNDPALRQAALMGIAGLEADPGGQALNTATSYLSDSSAAVASSATYAAVVRALADLPDEERVLIADLISSKTLPSSAARQVADWGAALLRRKAKLPFGPVA